MARENDTGFLYIASGHRRCTFQALRSAKTLKKKLPQSQASEKSSRSAKYLGKEIYYTGVVVYKPDSDKVRSLFERWIALFEENNTKFMRNELDSPLLKFLDDAENEYGHVVPFPSTRSVRSVPVLLLACGHA